MIPILSSDEMRRADAAAVARRSQGALVRDAGTAVGLEAKRLLGSCYAKRVAVLVGPGLNGADGRVSARWLHERGAHVDVIDVAAQPATLAGYDLIIDAAFGLGCSRPYVAPKVGTTPVLAVDLPSGVDADSGRVLGEPMAAQVTIALGALKHAHLTGESASYVGELRFAGLGIVKDFNDGLVEDDDLAMFVRTGRDDHKWDHAVHALVGSTLMPGAAELVVRGALAGGASMIRLRSREPIATSVAIPPEVVHETGDVVDARCRVVVAGPGVGRDGVQWLGDHLDGVRVPVVLDADGLDVALLERCANRPVPWVLTPHEGEFARLTGSPIPPNRIEAVRALARETGCVVLLKGPTTVISDAHGTVRVVRSGTSALATAGTGDVLSGLISASIARGHDPLSASALSAHLHGLAGSRHAPYPSASDVARNVALLVAELVTHN